MSDPTESKQVTLGKEDHSETFLRAYLYESSVMMNAPEVSQVLQSYPRSSNILCPRTPQNQMKKRSFLACNDPVIYDYSHPLETEPMSPQSSNGTHTREFNNIHTKEDPCQSPMVTEAMAFQGLSIQSPVVKNSPISSFHSYTPSRLFKNSRIHENGHFTNSPAYNSPAYRQVPLTVISSSTHESGGPTSASIGKPGSRWSEYTDSITTPVMSSTEIDPFSKEPSSSLSSLSTPNRLISPGQRSDTSNFILSPRSSRCSKPHMHTPRSKEGVTSSLAFHKKMNEVHTNYDDSNRSTDPKDPVHTEKKPATSVGLLEDRYLETRTDSWAFSEDSVAKQNDECMLPPPIQVIALVENAHSMDEASKRFLKGTTKTSKSLFNRPSIGSFEKLDTLVTSDYDTQEVLSDDDVDIDNTPFVLGSPEKDAEFEHRKTSARLVSDATSSQALSANDFNCYWQMTCDNKKSYLPNCVNSESNLSDLPSNTDLYGLHVIYEGIPAQGWIEDTYGIMKSKRSRLSLCEELMGMNRAHSNNSMGSLGIALEEGQSLCHVNSARDLITPPVALQDRLSPPPIKETNLTWLKN